VAEAGDCGPPAIAGTRAGLSRMNPSSVSRVNPRARCQDLATGHAMMPGRCRWLRQPAPRRSLPLPARPGAGLMLPATRGAAHICPLYERVRLPGPGPIRCLM